ncbi:hypothetical protein M407DRAFT_231071 [Tulasnella calospora MUT 4182]|uniref:Histone H1 n=1 Tax=Tulasnella calospora MUT 4182 TaxID=1051891 RepID=A0A0C3QBZ3_9AGAM|nr:hypothetical protein M407DRAFT_231071 [Tulasnella calospora MUT 4182]
MAVSKKASATKKSAAPSHPPFLDMIKECIAAHPDDAREGVSRPTIKKYLEDHYKLDTSQAAVSTNISRAITRGAEHGELVLPKGISGKVKLPPKKARHDDAKEVWGEVVRCHERFGLTGVVLLQNKKPVSKTTTSRTTTSKATTTKKPASKPATARSTKNSATTKAAAKPKTTARVAKATAKKAEAAKAKSATTKKASTKATPAAKKSARAAPKPAAKPAAKAAPKAAAKPKAAPKATSKAAAKPAAAKKTTSKAPAKKVS